MANVLFQELIDSAKTKMSERAREYENEVDSGINIEVAKQILREEDQFDKQRFRAKIKEKHREEKRKLKAAQKARASDEEEEVADDEEMENTNNDDISDGESSDGPDLSWLPDPDKIYGKQNADEEEASTASELEEKSEEESIVHR